MSERNVVSRRVALAGLGALSLTNLTRAPAVARSSWVSIEGARGAGVGNALSFGSIDGKPQAWEAHNAGRPYSCELMKNGRVLRLELRSGEQWAADTIRGARVERTMVQAVTADHDSEALPLSTDIWWAFSFLIEPGAPISGLGARYEWLVFADVHSGLAELRSIPLQFEIQPGDILAMQLHGDILPNRNNYVYRARTPLSRGQWHDLVLKLNIDPLNATGRGGAHVSLDGRTIHVYDGPLGFTNDSPYAQLQIYRGSPNPGAVKHETVAICYANCDLRTHGTLQRRRFRRPDFPEWSPS